MDVTTNSREFRTKYPDFRNFLEAVWDFLNLPKPTWIQYDIARWLGSSDEKLRRFILEAFRGVGKSWMTVAFVIWVLGHNPNYRILVVSASKALADEFSTFCLQLIREMPDCTWLAPKEGQRDSKIAFDVAPATPDKAPSVKSLGITSQLTGSRADLIISDDVEIPSNSMTPAMRQKLAEQVKEYDAILKPERHARIIVLGTPQTEDSVYNKLQERGYLCRIWPARFPNELELVEYGERLAPKILNALVADPTLVGSPTDAARFNDLDLRERALSYGAAGFALQFQLRTRLSDLERYPLKVHDLIVMECDPVKGIEKPIWCNDPDRLMNVEHNLAMKGDFYYRAMELVGKWVDYQGIVLAIDPAGRGKDETGYAVVAMLNGFLYVLACGGVQGGYDEHVLRFLSQMAARFKVNKVIVEANFGDGMYTSLLKPVMAKYHEVFIEEVKHSIQKEKRICDVLEPVFQGHRIVVDTSVIETDYQTIQTYPVDVGYQYSLVHQLTRLTREKGALAHDDRVDALSIAVSYWVEQMALDADQEQQDERQRALDKELENFISHATGNDTRSTQLWTELMR